MAIKIFSSAAAVLACSLLSACGGGGSASTSADGAQVAAGAAQAPILSTCETTPLAPGRQVGRTLVAFDAYVYPALFGVQDRSFAPIRYTNATAGMITIQVVSTGTRKIDTPAGLVGDTPLFAFVSVFDETDQRLVASRQDFCPDTVDRVAAGESATAAESTVFNVVVPAGHTFTFTSYARIVVDVGSTGSVVLTTTNLDVRAVEL